MAARLSSMKSTVGSKKKGPKKLKQTSNELNRIRAANRIEEENRKIANRLGATSMQRRGVAPLRQTAESSNAVNRRRDADRSCQLLV